MSDTNGLTANAIDMLSRLSHSRTSGKSFDGNRDLYTVAGYKRTLTIHDYFGKYWRQDIAKRIVSIFASETWRKPPRVLDGDSLEDAQEDTEFTRAWKQLVSPVDNFDEISDKRSIWHYLERVDRLAGIGEYAVLLLGVSGDTGLDEELPRVDSGVGHNLIYLRPYAQDCIDLNESMLNRNKSSARFGLPERYRIKLSTNSGHTDVHWSRVVHVAENPDTSEIEAAPRLEAVWNLLDGLEQVIAGSKEAFWRLVLKGMILEAEKDRHVEAVDEAALRNFVHGLTRTLEVDGWKPNILGGETVDPSAMVDVIMTLVAAATGIPKRILMGSEQGQLASSQDMKNWNNQIGGRQKKHAEPVILRPFINRLVYAGSLPRPSTGQYYVDWPSLYESNEIEEAQVAHTYAQTLKELASPGVENIVDMEGFIKTFISRLPADAILDLAEILHDESTDS